MNREILSEDQISSGYTGFCKKKRAKLYDSYMPSTLFSNPLITLKSFNTDMHISKLQTIATMLIRNFMLKQNQRQPRVKINVTLIEKEFLASMSECQGTTLMDLQSKICFTLQNLASSNWTGTCDKEPEQSNKETVLEPRSPANFLNLSVVDRWQESHGSHGLTALTMECASRRLTYYII